MNKIKDRVLPVGFLFHLDGFVYEVVDQGIDSTCEECAFAISRVCASVVCSAYKRFDDKHVIFKKHERTENS
jgi:hypothetical protein